MAEVDWLGVIGVTLVMAVLTTVGYRVNNPSLAWLRRPKRVKS